MSSSPDMSQDQNVVTVVGSEMASLSVLDHQEVEWHRVDRTAFLIHQHLRYDYPGPIEDLNHRLIIVPPDRHLDQRRIVHRLEVTGAEARVSERGDRFGNLVLDVYAPRVERAIDFEAWIVVERRSDLDPRVEIARWGVDHLTETTSRTQPNEALERAAGTLLEAGHRGLDLVEVINAWVYRHMRYAHDVTDIHTTAADALALGQGVCQDYAHIMLALCHLCDLRARYVSGHLLGEGGTHAWVEVLLPDGESGGSVVHAFDPTHDRRAGLSYVTVAVGRDYGDVAPTSGSFRAEYSGRLSARKRVDLTAVDYRPAG